MDEFELIDRFFPHLGARREDVEAGVGDDAAVLQVPAGRSLLLSTDTLVAGRHFPAAGLPPEAIGHRALAVSLSDIAAMGGEAAWALLSLSLEDVDPAWLGAFSSGLGRLAEREGVALVGGNIARGPLQVTVTVAGLCAPGEAVGRKGAQAGDALFVTGALGGGAAGLRALSDGAAWDGPEARAYALPQPRLRAGRALAGYLRAAIDISDGLLGDLGKLLAASAGLGAEVESARLPLAPGAGVADALGPSDDYELLLCVPADAAEAVAALSPARLGCALHRVGRVVPAAGIRVDGRMPPGGALKGYRHFP